ncbi:hypothetical protein [Sporosarcina cyprini]|uniref:hypothetical protein n=1 Tax=Sporosarcina cyprini TaxID=2910523 RepID=UPI001EE05A73|nr:hypothetical protein [Sporosarcina cyprini]MCG3089643.1 hypothetical protein [Sporosarcina cyprini]
MLIGIYERFAGRYDHSFRYTSGWREDTITSAIRAVRGRIRALIKIYERLARRYEHSFRYTSGSQEDTSTHFDIRAVRRRIRAVADNRPSFLKKTNKHPAK